MPRWLQFWINVAVIVLIAHASSIAGLYAGKYGFWLVLAVFLAGWTHRSVVRDEWW